MFEDQEFSFDAQELPGRDFEVEDGQTEHLDADSDRTTEDLAETIELGERLPSLREFAQQMIELAKVKARELKKWYVQASERLLPPMRT